MVSLRAIVFATLAAASAWADEPSALVIKGGTVVDVVEGRLRPGLDVVVENGRITALGPSVEAPSGAKAIDATGRFLIPGLWDMHVHTLSPGRPEATFPLFVANGVTGVRDMHTTTPLAELQVLRRDVESGRRLGPRLVFAGPLVDGDFPFWQGSLSVHNEAEARQAVARLAADGADFVKPYDTLAPEAYRGLVAAAREHKLPIAGHVPMRLSTAEVAASGQRTIEHLDRLLDEASTEQATVEAELWALIAKGDDAPPEAFTALARRAAATTDPEKLKRLAETLAAHPVWVTPTLAVLETDGRDAAWARADARLRYVPVERRTRWLKGLPEHLAAAELEAHARTMAQLGKALGELARRGVRVLAGTDVGNPLLVPGFSLHDELELLVGAGSSPAQALAAATREASACLQRDDIGVIETGRRADLVLLDGDPLADIRNSRRIHAVVLGGRLLDRAALDGLLAEAERRAAGAQKP